MLSGETKLESKMSNQSQSQGMKSIELCDQIIYNIKTGEPVLGLIRVLGAGAYQLDKTLPPEKIAALYIEAAKHGLGTALGHLDALFPKFREEIFPTLNQSGATLLHHACQGLDLSGQLPRAVHTNIDHERLAAIKLLINKTDINALDSNQQTPLVRLALTAVEGSSIDSIFTYPFSFDDEGSNDQKSKNKPLAKLEVKEVKAEKKDEKAEITTQQPDYLSMALTCLLKAGANPFLVRKGDNTQNKTDNNYECATTRGKCAVRETSPFMIFCLAGNKSYLTTFLSEFTPKQQETIVNQPNDMGMTSLHSLVDSLLHYTFYGDKTVIFEIIKFLIEKGAVFGEKIVLSKKLLSLIRGEGEYNQLTPAERLERVIAKVLPVHDIKTLREADGLTESKLMPGLSWLRPNTPAESELLKQYNIALQKIQELFEKGDERGLAAYLSTLSAVPNMFTYIGVNMQDLLVSVPVPAIFPNLVNFFNFENFSTLWQILSGVNLLRSDENPDNNIFTNAILKFQANYFWVASHSSALLRDYKFIFHPEGTPQNKTHRDWRDTKDWTDWYEFHIFFRKDNAFDYLVFSGMIERRGTITEQELKEYFNKLGQQDPEKSYSKFAQALLKSKPQQKESASATRVPLTPFYDDILQLTANKKHSYNKAESYFQDDEFVGQQRYYFKIIEFLTQNAQVTLRDYKVNVLAYLMKFWFNPFALPEQEAQKLKERLTAELGSDSQRQFRPSYNDCAVSVKKADQLKKMPTLGIDPEDQFKVLDLLLSACNSVDPTITNAADNNQLTPLCHALKRFINLPPSELGTEEQMLKLGLRVVGKFLEYGADPNANKAMHTRDLMVREVERHNTFAGKIGIGGILDDSSTRNTLLTLKDLLGKPARNIHLENKKLAAMCIPYYMAICNVLSVHLEEGCVARPNAQIVTQKKYKEKAEADKEASEIRGKLITFIENQYRRIFTEQEMRELVFCSQSRDGKDYYRVCINVEELVVHLLSKKKKEIPVVIELAFLLDMTNSMRDVISQTKDAIMGIIEDAQANFPNAKLKLACVAYSEYKEALQVHMDKEFKKCQSALPGTLEAITVPGRSVPKLVYSKQYHHDEYVDTKKRYDEYKTEEYLKTINFTDNADLITKFLDNIVNNLKWGVDASEALELGITELQKLSWEEPADKESLRLVRTVVLFTDSPPHGLKGTPYLPSWVDSDDHFPKKGDIPGGLYWETAVEKLKAGPSPAFYTLTCGNDVTTQVVNKRIAELTGGVHCLLSNLSEIRDKITKAIERDSRAEELSRDVTKQGIDINDTEAVKKLLREDKQLYQTVVQLYGENLGIAVDNIRSTSQRYLPTRHDFLDSQPRTGAATQGVSASSNTTVNTTPQNNYSLTPR